MNTTMVFLDKRKYLGAKANNIFASRRKLSIMGTDQFYKIVTFCVTLVQRKMQQCHKIRNFMLKCLFTNEYYNGLF